MKQQNACGLLVHMSRVKGQRPHRNKGNHCEKGFAADVATRITAEDFTGSRADEQWVACGDANLSSQCRISLTSARPTNRRPSAEIVRVPVRPTFFHRAKRMRLDLVAKPKPVLAF